jgi:hypothetical protein
MWEEYATKTMPDIPPDSVQYRETRKAFYAGAFALFYSVLTINDKGTEEAITRLMKGFELQFMEYQTELIVASKV